MKSILVATDFSTRSEVALLRSSALASEHSAKMTVIHVVEDDQPTRLTRSAESEAGALMDALGGGLSGKADTSGIVTRGEPQTEILNAAAACCADMIVIGSHRRNLVRNTFIGTTAERLIRASAVPVLVARSESPAPYMRPLSAVDLHEADLSSVTAAVRLGLVSLPAVAVVFAYAAEAHHMLRQAGVTDHEMHAYLEEEKNNVAPRAAATLQGAGLDPAKLICKPALFNAYEPILDAAREKNADLLIIGTRRKKAFQRLTLGSVTEALLRRATMDVFVAPPD